MIEKKHNYFYRITNQINWKFYFGIHSTDKLEDGYFGSGKLIKEAINKYGKKNFVKTIISDYPTRKEASDHERLAVTKIQIDDKMCYNCRFGGDNENPLSMEARKKISEFNIGRFVGELNHFFGKSHSNETIEKLREIRLGTTASLETRIKISESLKGENHIWFGITGSNHPLFEYKHSEQFCQQISERQQGEKNSFFGRTHSDKYKECLSKKMSNEGNPFYGKSHSPELMKQMLLNNPQRKPCQIDGILFITKSDAKKYYKISESTLMKRLNSNKEEWSEWKFIENPNKEKMK